MDFYNVFLASHSCKLYLQPFRQGYNKYYHYKVNIAAIATINEQSKKYITVSTNIKKIFNDPVYGFISFPFENLYKIIDSPDFQRLRRISQMGFSFLVYPGAVHTRFHHALGALHLMSKAVHHLKSIGIEISEQEANAVCMAILCHDVGHGPFSHALEKELVNRSHEALSLDIMKSQRSKFQEDTEIFDMAIDIFCDQYPKKYLHQLVSSQLDMDRLDYLTRDSYFSGVVEGAVGYDRIIHMLNVSDNQLVVEEKGLYSVEKFLMARRTMYWQVYLHKTALVAEKMLLHAIRRSKELIKEGGTVKASESLTYLLKNFDDNSVPSNDILSYFLDLDDTDILHFLKSNINHSDKILSILCEGLIYRKLFKVKLTDLPTDQKTIDKINQTVKNYYNIDDKDLRYLVYTGEEGNQSYNAEQDSIFIKLKEGGVTPVSALSSFFTKGEKSTKYYLCYPKNIII